METAIPIALVLLASLQPTEASASQPASASCYCFTKDVGIPAVVVAELKFSQVEPQIFLTHMMKAAHNATLEERPERFEVVCVNLPANIFALAVVHSLVWKILFQEAITGVFVRRNQIDRFTDGLANECIQRDSIRTLDNLADDISLPANSSDDANFAALLATTDVSFFVPVAVLILTANEGFVHLNNTQ